MQCSSLGRIDREANSVLRFVAESVQSGALVRGVVTVTDVNDNAPAFPRCRVAVTTSESAPIGSLLFVGRAHDPDTFLYAVIHYEIVAGDELTQFRVDGIGSPLGFELRLRERSVCAMFV